MAARLDFIRDSEERDPELVNDPVWQSFVTAPTGPTETEEQRCWSDEARLGEGTPGDVVSAEIASRCQPGK